MLKFIGSGSAFNTALGNNSAFIEETGHMTMIDCGGTVFHRLKEIGILEKIDTLYIVITHTHPDHIGSLGELIFFMHYVKKKKVTLIFPDGVWLEALLKYFGVAQEMYTLIAEKDVLIKDEVLGDIALTFNEVKHVEIMPAYSICLSWRGETIYYSGDSSTINSNILKRFKEKQIQKIYQDTCGLDYPQNVHLYLGKLCQLIAEEDRHRVWCMHLDQHIQKEAIKQAGFNYVENY